VSLVEFVDGHPYPDDADVIASDAGSLTLGELRARIDALADALRAAGVEPGHGVGNLVAPGPSAIIVMFAIWRAGAVYAPVNNRFTADEVASLVTEAGLALLVGTPDDLAAHPVPARTLEYEWETGNAVAGDTGRPAALPAPEGDPRESPKITTYAPDVAVISRTSGTTGKPKAVLLRHRGTTDAIDASLVKLRGRAGGPAPSDAARTTDTGGPVTPRLNLIPVSLALWGAVWNTLFSFRAGFGVVLLDTFSTEKFARLVREHAVTSTVLPPAMLSMLADDPAVTGLAPLRMVRSITAPLSVEVARKFHAKFGIVVLNSYGQTELGGEVVGWTAADTREFGESKLGAVGRPYKDIDLRIQLDHGSAAATGERGEILVRSPFRMGGYAGGDGAVDESRLDAEGYLRTGDLGHLDEDGFLWVSGRVSDMINRGGLKVFPDEVEEALRSHPLVRDAGVTGVPDERLGEAPHAWIVLAGPAQGASATAEAGPASAEAASAEALGAWCRERVAPYKVPTGFTFVSELPRNGIGKLLRRSLRV
jgi:acyl-CoA synthetase (AMP-forming)/AMP-acid ligase II